MNLNLNFFIDFDIKRLGCSEYLLINGTLIFQEGYIPNIIIKKILWYNNKKMIPGIFIIINNKMKKDIEIVF